MFYLGAGSVSARVPLTDTQFGPRFACVTGVARLRVVFVGRAAQIVGRLRVVQGSDAVPSAPESSNFSDEEKEC